MWSSTAVASPTFLPTSAAGRSVLMVLSGGAVAFAGLFLYALVVGPVGQTWGEWLVRIGLGEFFAALFATGCVGLAWSVAAPSWLPPVAWRVGRWMAVCLLIPWAILLGLVVWPW
jgi:hypothetical protein